MFGWEFPPIKSGGLGVACQGIVEGLVHNNHAVYLVLPKTSPEMQMYDPNLFKVLNAKQKDSKVNVETLHIPTTLYSPYETSEGAYFKWLNKVEGQKDEPNSIYGRNIMEEVYRYAAHAANHAKKVPHDVIHTHDWLTTEAGIQAKKFSDKPHVMHVHATEFDRSGENPNQQVYDLERKGMHHADRVIAVSRYTKKILMKHYGVPDWKIDVVHNAVKFDKEKYQRDHFIDRQDKIVLFLGRMTMQKGPDYFLQMGKKVLEVMKNVKFVMAGDGDMMEQAIQIALNLGIERNVLFSGFLKGKEIARAYGEADLYVMPSVSEPFGIAPLEAIQHGTPVLVSKQAGVNEVIKSSLKADFWDIDDMASKVIAALSYPALSNTLRKHSSHELNQLNWQKQAEGIAHVYGKALV